MICPGCNRDVFSVEWIGTVLRCNTCINGKKARLMNVQSKKPLDPEQAEWLWNRPPTCKCEARVKMTLTATDTGGMYVCFQCGDRVNILAANADLRNLSNADNQRVRRL